MNHVLPSYPPVHTHRSVPLGPSSALERIETYLSTLRSTPHHHPDALLTPSGVTFHPSSGPGGNLQISNLRRVSAGLKGENLALAPEDLLALELLARKDGRRGGGGGGDDGGGGGHELQHSAALARRLKEGVGLSGIGPSRARGLERSDGTPVRGVLKRRKLEEGSQESAAGAAMGRRDARRSGVKDEGDGGEGGTEGDWMEMEAWNEQQEVVEGEVGERGTTAVQEGGEEPVVREMGEDGDGRVKDEDGGKKPLTKEEKERRKEEKKRRLKDAQRSNHGKRVKKE